MEGPLQCLLLLAAALSSGARGAAPVDECLDTATLRICAHVDQTCRDPNASVAGDWVCECDPPEASEPPNTPGQQRAAYCLESLMWNTSTTTGTVDVDPVVVDPSGGTPASQEPSEFPVLIVAMAAGGVCMLLVCVVLFCGHRGPARAPASAFTSVTFGDSLGPLKRPHYVPMSPLVPDASPGILAGSSDDSDLPPPARRRVAAGDDSDDDSDELVAPTRQRAAARAGSDDDDGDSFDLPGFGGGDDGDVDDDDDDDDGDTTEGSDEDFEDSGGETGSGGGRGRGWRQKVLDLDSESTDSGGSTPRYLRVETCPAPHGGLDGVYELVPDTVLGKRVWTKEAGTRITYDESKSWVLGGRFTQRSKWAAPRRQREWAFLGDPPVGSPKKCTALCVTRVHDVSPVAAVVLAVVAALPCTLARAEAAAMVTARRRTAAAAAVVVCAAAAVKSAGQTAAVAAAAAGAAAVVAAAGAEAVAAGVARDAVSAAMCGLAVAAMLPEEAAEEAEAVGQDAEAEEAEAVGQDAEAEEGGDADDFVIEEEDEEDHSAEPDHAAGPQQFTVTEPFAPPGVAGAAEAEVADEQPPAPRHKPKAKVGGIIPWRRPQRDDSSDDTDPQVIAENRRLYASPMLEAAAGRGFEDDGALDMHVLAGACVPGFQPPPPAVLAMHSLTRAVPPLGLRRKSGAAPLDAFPVAAAAAAAVAVATPRERLMLFSPTANAGEIHPYHRPPSVLQEVAEDDTHVTNHPQKAAAIAASHPGLIDHDGAAFEEDDDAQSGASPRRSASPESMLSGSASGLRPVVFTRLKTELLEKTQEVDELRAAVAEKTETLRHSEDELRVLRTEAAGLQQQLAARDDTAARRDEEVERLKDRVDAEKLTAADLEAELAQAEAAREAAGRSMRSLAEMNDAIGQQCQELMAQVAEQNAELRDRDDAHRAVTAELKTLRAGEANAAVARAVASAAQDASETLRAANRALTNRVGELEAWCARKTKFALSARLKADSARLVELRRMHEHDLMAAESVLLTALPTLFKAEAVARQDLATLAAFEFEEITARAVIDGCAVQVGDAALACNPCAPVEQERAVRQALASAAAEEHVALLAGSLRDLERRTHQLDGDYREVAAAHKAAAEQLQRTQQELQLTQEDLKEEQEVTALKVDNAVADARRECREEYERQLATKEDRYRANENELRDLQPRLHQALAEVDELTAALQQAQHDHTAALHTQYLSQESVAAALKAELGRVKEALCEKQDAHDDLMQRSQRAKAKFLADKKGWEGLEGRLAAARSELSATKTQLVGLECERKDLKSDLRHLQRTAANLETQREHLEELLAEAQAENKRYVEAGWGVLGGENEAVSEASAGGSPTSQRSRTEGLLPGMPRGQLHALPAGPLAELVRLREDNAALEAKVKEAKKAYGGQRAAGQEQEVLLRQKEEEIATLEGALRRQVDPLRVEIEALNGSLETKAATIRQHEAALAELSARAAASEKRAVDFEAEAKRQRKKRKAVVGDIDALRDEYTALKAKFEALVALPKSFLVPEDAKSEYSAGSAPPVERTATCVALEPPAMPPAASASAPDAVTHTLLQHLDLSDVVGALRMENSKLAQASAAMQDRVRVLEAQVAEMEEVRKSDEAGARRLRRGLEKAELELRPLRIELALLQKKDAEHAEDSDARVVQLEQEKARLAAKVARLSQANTEWEHREHDGVVDAFRKENQALKNRIAVAEETSFAQLSEARRLLHQRTQTLEDARLKITQLEARVAEAETHPFGSGPYTPTRSARKRTPSADVLSPGPGGGVVHAEGGDLVGARFAGPASSSRVVLIQILEEDDGTPKGGATVDDIPLMLAHASDVPKEWFQILAHTTAPRGAYLRLRCDSREVPQPAANKTLQDALEKLPACFREAECQQLADVVDVLSTELSHSHERARQLEWQRKKLEHEVLLSNIRPPAPAPAPGPSPLDFVVSLDAMAKRVDSCISACRTKGKSAPQKKPRRATRTSAKPPLEAHPQPQLQPDAT